MTDRYERRFLVRPSAVGWIKGLPWANTSFIVDGYFRIAEGVSGKIRRQFDLSPDRHRVVGHDSEILLRTRAYGRTYGEVGWLDRVIGLQIPANIAADAMLEASFTKVHKQRSAVTIDGIVWTLDEYRWENEGLVLVSHNTFDRRESEQLLTPEWSAGEMSNNESLCDEELARLPIAARDARGFGLEGLTSDTEQSTAPGRRIHRIEISQELAKYREIERRFLANVPPWVTEVGSLNLIVQDYLISGENVAVRVRLKAALESEADSRPHMRANSLPELDHEMRSAWLAIKGKRSGNERDEYEVSIPVSFARQIADSSRSTIVKERYAVIVEKQLWTIDVFCGSNRPLIVAECEVETAEIAAKLAIPSFCTEEICGDARFDNERLATRPYSTWQ